MTPNGIETGRCVMSVGQCEITGWCPVEIDSPSSTVQLQGVQNFTIFIKCNVRFPSFGVSLTNVGIGNSTAAYLQNCRWNPQSDYYCPIFTLQDIIAQTGSTYASYAAEGGVVAINIRWDCDLDRAAGNCRPVFGFTRCAGRAPPAGSRS